MTLSLAEIRDFAYRFVPPAAADERLYLYGCRSWWPAHELGHFLVASKRECRQFQFGLDLMARSKPHYYRSVAKEIAAMSVSQRLLRNGGHIKLADEEIEYSDGDMLDCSFEAWCKRRVAALLRQHRIERLPTQGAAIERLLKRKAREMDTKFYTRRQAAEGS